VLTQLSTTDSRQSAASRAAVCGKPAMCRGDAAMGRATGRAACEDGLLSALQAAAGQQLVEDR
jgi:hypothetical protein